MIKENQTTSRAIAKQWDFDVVGGYEVVKVMFELRGPRAGQSREWTGFFSDSSLEHTLRSLRHCGWTGETLGDMSGMGSAEVEVVLESRKDGEKTYEQVRFVNRPPSLRLKNPITGDALKRFSEKMERLTRDSARNYGVVPAAAAQQQQQQRAATSTPDSAYDSYDGPGEDNIPF